MQEEDKIKLRQELELMSDEDLRNKMFNSKKEDDPEGYEILFQEAKKRTKEGKLHQASVNNIANPKKEEKLDLDTVSLRLVVFILGVNVLGAMLFFIWQNVAGVVDAQAIKHLWILFIDIYLAFNLWRGKVWAKKWIIVRSLIGCLLWVITDISQSNIIGAGVQVVYFGAIIALLIKQVNRNLAKLLGFMAICALVFISMQNIDAIFYHKKVQAQMQLSGLKSFTSTKFDYSINTPEDWKIIERKDFDKIDPALTESDAEIALLKVQGKGYCLMVPEILKGYGREITLAGLRDIFLNDINKIPNVKIGSNKFLYDADREGFELTYSAWVEGFEYSYIVLYAVRGELGMQLYGWSFASEGKELFDDVHRIMKMIKMSD